MTFMAQKNVFIGSVFMASERGLREAWECQEIILLWVSQAKLFSGHADEALQLMELNDHSGFWDACITYDVSNLMGLEYYEINI